MSVKGKREVLCGEEQRSALLPTSQAIYTCAAAQRAPPSRFFAVFGGIRPPDGGAVTSQAQAMYRLCALYPPSTPPEELASVPRED